MRAGEDITINNPQMTLTGKRGTLVARNRIEWADLPDAWEVFTGTWTVISGTGDYARLSGGGLAARSGVARWLQQVAVHGPPRSEVDRRRAWEAQRMRLSRYVQ